MSRPVSDEEREAAAAMARADFAADRITVDELEDEVQAALEGRVGGARPCRYLSPFPSPRDPTKVERR